MAETPKGSLSVGSQTLDRGLRMLETLAEESALSIVELAERLEVHRSVAYRILRTLEDHGLAVRDAGGRVSLGARMAALARGVAADLQSAALPELTKVANELGMTAFLVVLDHAECVTITSVEPRHAVAAVAQRPGTRHDLGRGAPGIAIQALLSDAQWQSLGSRGEVRPEAEQARRTGFAESSDEVVAGLRSVAAGFRIPGATPAAIAVVYVGDGRQVAEIGSRLASAARLVADELN